MAFEKRPVPVPDFSTYRVPRVVRGLGHNLLIAAARRQGLRVRVVSRDPAVFTLSRGPRAVRVTRLDFSLNPPLAKTICQRKEVTRWFLRRAGLPVPRGALLRLVEDRAPVARASRLGFPLVLKPPDGSAGRLVYPELRTRAELRARLRDLQEFGLREVLAERHVAGRNYRLLVLDGRLIGLSERLPASVAGDGRSTIRRLVARRNAFRRGNLPVIPILLDADARRMLRRQGLRPSSVLPRGRVARLHEVVNIAKGGTCREVLARAHPGWRNVARQVLRAIPEARLLGADLVAADIGRSPGTQRWWILEVNSNPDFELHHFPWEGVPSAPADAIVRALFPL